ncbi:MAG: hypothetical protein TECD_00041 [Hyphomicrobiaceae bacterium hypho_1]
MLAHKVKFFSLGRKRVWFSIVSFASKTERDVTHGAIMTSGEFSSDIQEKRLTGTGRRPVYREAADGGLPRVNANSVKV